MSGPLYIRLPPRHFELMARGALAWILRRDNGAFAVDLNIVGRGVRAVKGYGKSERPLIGRIAQVRVEPTIAGVFQGVAVVDFREIYPWATSPEAALAEAERLFRDGRGPFVLYLIKLENPNGRL